MDELALLQRIVQDFRRDSRELVIAMRPAILQEQFESSGRAHALKRAAAAGEFTRPEWR